MNVRQAREIISRYGKLLGEMKGGKMFMGENLLPCSKSRIRFAIYYYLTVLVRLGPSQKETIESLMIAYSHLGFFTSPELAESLNHILQQRVRRPGAQTAKINEYAEDIRRLNSEKSQLMREIEEFVREEIAERNSSQTLFN